MTPELIKLLRSLLALSLITIFACSDSSQVSPSTSEPEPTGPDPLYSEQWYLKNSGQSTFSLGSATSGKDLNFESVMLEGYTGKGIHILLSDDGLETTHEDLAANFDLSRSRDYTQPAPYTGAGIHHSDYDGHGTAVAGIMSAVANNAKGLRGIASGATLASANLISTEVSFTTAMLIDQASTTADIVNQSWGSTQNSINTIPESYYAQLESSTATGRGNKGIIFVQSAGNNYSIDIGGGNYRVGNSNFDGTKATPFTIVTSALQASDLPATRSSTGSNLWISAYGGGNGATNPAILSTDRSGCTLGLSNSFAFQNLFESGKNSLNANCNYTSIMNGTSAAAPMVSGAIALMLEANSNLSWRDIKFILASTANQVNPEIGAVENPNVSSPSGHVWQQGWVTNAAGFQFHNRFGFGKLNIAAAVTMAKTYISALGSWADTGELTSGSIGLSIPDQSSAGVTDSINVSSGLTIETVKLKISATHADAGQLGFEITSPSGTKSIVKNVNDALSGTSNFSDTIFITHAFFGESANGTWTIKAIDGFAGSTGTLDQWSITVYGH
jgi:hypothetical protein